MSPEETELLERLLDGSADAAAIERLLAAGPDVRKEIVDALRLNGLLHAGLGPDPACDRLADVVAVAIPQGGQALESRVMERIHGLPPKRSRRRLSLVAAAAVLLLALGSWALLLERPLAGLVAGGPGVVSRPLRDGDVVAVPPSSWAWIRYPDGTTLQVGADSLLTLRPRRVQIARGVVFADVRPQSEPLILVSPHAETKVLGTSFSLAVGAESTRLLVREGRVAFSNAGAAIELRGGQTATAAAATPPVAEPIRSELLRRLGKEHFMLGIMSGGGEKWIEETRAQGCRWDLRYQHLGGNWTQWNPNGAFVSLYLEESAKLGALPVFTYYGLLRSTPVSPDPAVVAAEIARNSRNIDLMRKYFQDLRLLMQKAGARRQPVILHVEPGVWSRFLTAPEFAPHALDQIPMIVRSSGVPELQGLDDNAASFGKAFGVLRDRFAPNVLLAWHVSKVDGLSPSTAADALLRCGAWELLFTDVGDRDAGYREARGSAKAWWTDQDFASFRDWGRDVYARTGLPLLVWRIPLGNTRMAACNNTPWHYGDNRAEYWLEDYPTNKHLAEWAEAGFIGLLFGGGTTECTVHLDNAKDGATNPTPVPGNAGERSDFVDDDGGYLRLRAGRYYQSKPLEFR